jgi:transposase
MYSIVETPDFLDDAKAAGITEQERSEIITYLAANRLAGVLIAGTGGARKARFVGRGKGKSGGYRVITFFGGEDIYPDSAGTRNRLLRISFAMILLICMIRAGFLDPESRKDLTELARDGSAAHRLARRANALVLLDDGMSCGDVAKVLLLDDDTVRTWHRLYEEDGIEGLASFGYEGGACRLSDAQQDKLKGWIAATLPRTTREVGAWIETECGITYESRSGLIALLHRLGMEHRKPKAVSSKLDPDKQDAFIKTYNALLNHMGDDEAVLFGDAVHPTHAVRPVGCWSPKDTPLAVPQTSGRQRLNIHGAIDLETGKTRMIEAATVNAMSTIMLLMAIEKMYPGKRLIHLFVDNARYHHAKLVQAWLARPGCRIKLHFIPAYCPHLDPIERLWGLMHKHVTHNRCHATFADFKAAILTFLRQEVPGKWDTYCDQVTDNFRIISPKDFRVLA